MSVAWKKHHVASWCHMQTGCLKRFCYGLAVIRRQDYLVLFPIALAGVFPCNTVIVLCVCSGLVVVFGFTTGPGDCQVPLGLAGGFPSLHAVRVGEFSMWCGSPCSFSANYLAKPSPLLGLSLLFPLIPQVWRKFYFIFCELK